MTASLVAASRSRSPLRTSPSSRRWLSGIAAATVALTLVGCSGEEGDKAPQSSPTEAFAKARTTLDEAAQVKIAMVTKDLPDGVTGLISARGTATDQPAFDGTITVPVAGGTPQVAVRAVGTKVWAVIPFTTGYSEIDPAEYGAPNPATLIDAETGFGSLLAAPEKITQGDSVRGGANNSEVLTSYEAQIPGAAVKKVMPSAEANTPFSGEFLISDTGELRQVALTGVFYSGEKSLTYTVTFEDYSTTKKDIVTPTPGAATS